MSAQPRPSCKQKLRPDPPGALPLRGWGRGASAAGTALTRAGRSYLINLPEPAPPVWAVCAAAACGGAILTVTGACVKAPTPRSQPRTRIPKMAPAVLKRARAPGGQAVLLNVNVPETRGTVLAVYALFDDLGKGFGPFLVAVRPPLLPGCF